MFKTIIPVLVNHLNYGNHLGYDAMLSIMQEARMRWLKGADMNELSLEGNVGYIVSEVQVQYKSEAFHGDQLTVALSIENRRKKSFDMRYEIKNEKTEALVASGMTRHIFYDFQQKKIANAPEKFKHIVEVVTV